MYKELERKYAEFVGTKYAVAVSSGTAALHLSLVALGIGHGDEVIVPDFTMAACGFAVSYTGAKVVTVDCDNTLNIDVTKIEEKITARTKAIMAVHIYGRLCNMDAINDIARRHGLRVIEDGCEAQGAAKGGKRDCLVFSFYKNKIIHAEEGGIVCTDSEEIAADIRDLKNMAFGEEHDYFHKRIGFNYRMPDSQAQMALESLSEYPLHKFARRDFERITSSMLCDRRPPRDAVWVYDMPICESEKQRDDDFDFYTMRGIAARKFFKPLSTMPMWEQEVGENALLYSKRGVYIPVDFRYFQRV